MLFSHVWNVLKGVCCSSLLALIVLVWPASSAWAECACFCVDGELRTMCTTVEEAQGNPSHCAAHMQRACPEDPAGATGATYETPAEGAENCRDLRVFDALHGTFKDLKACDVTTAES